MDLFDILVDRINEMMAGFVRALPQLGIALLVVLPGSSPRPRAACFTACCARRTCDGH